MAHPAARGARRRAYLALTLVTLGWGAAYPLLKVAVDAFTPALAVCLRFALAALCALPGAWPHLRDRAAARAGCRLGAINFGIFWLMAHGLAELPVGRTAFLMGLSVVAVPLMDAAWQRLRPGAAEIAGALLSAAGIGLITGYRPAALQPADVMVLGAAALTALGILMLQAYGTPRPLPATAVVFYLALTVAVLALPAALASDFAQVVPTPAGIGGLLYGAVVANVLCYAVQIRMQPRLPASTAALIYALKPLFAALTAWPLAGEVPTLGLWRGGGLIVAAALLPPLAEAWRARRRATAAPPIS